MLKIFTGRNAQLPDALVEAVGRAMAETDRAQYVVVPKQLTLLTERMLLSGLKLRGSFQLRVMSPARLCTQIFEAAGFPEGVRVDERGRVMLVRRAIRAAGDRLSIYKNADRRRGFADRCARQLELFTQCAITPDQLRACAEESAGMTRMKFSDLAALMEIYAEQTAGLYQDGETELIAAAERAGRADFLRDADLWFFGFDIMPPTLTALIAAVSGMAQGAALFLPLANDADARDYDCYRPIEKQMNRLAAVCAGAGVAVERVRVEDEAAQTELNTLEREIFAYPVRPAEAAPKRIRLRSARDVREECMLAAATARRLAISGMRYGEMQILCQNIDGYRPMLMEAFRMYDVPLFLQNSRPVSRMAVAECLLTALRVIERNFHAEDVFTLMRTGYMDLTCDEADRLANYAVRRGVDHGRWLRPFVRGNDAEIAEMEPLRKKLTAPLLAFRDGLKKAGNLKAQLAAAFEFLMEIGAYQRSQEIMREMEAAGMRESAGELSQAWNRIIGAMDQMAELMGGEKLSLRELSQTLAESLDAAAIKPLPQSGDAVYAQSLDRILMQPAKVLMILGVADRNESGEEGLLTPAQKRSLSEQARAYLGPDETDAARMRRFYLKSALGMAQRAVYFSCPLAGVDGSPQQPGMAIALLKQIFPGVEDRGGVSGDAEFARTLACAPNAAERYAARALADRKAGKKPESGDLAAERALAALSEKLPDVRDRLRRINRLLQGAAGDSINPATARAVYGRLKFQSITRLERFAGCPFSYFAAYGLKPDRVEPFHFDRRDTGSLLHEAVYEFLRASGRELNAMTAEAARLRMERIVDQILQAAGTNTPMEDSAAVRAEARSLRSAACRCAQVLADHMQGSQFYTRQLEKNFGREDGLAALKLGDCTIEGRIDRVDAWDAGNCLRVIDFKLGGKPINLAGAYHGLQLQLPVYLGAALKKTGARSAGVYYFALDEGIANTQSTDPAQVERERAGKFRMSGLLPEDPERIRAQTPDAERVFQARMTAAGKPYANVPCADDVNFDRLIRHTLRMAQKHIDGIQSGEAQVSPSNFEQMDACGICDYRAACLFDAHADAGRVRRFKNIKWNEVFERMALEDGEQKTE